MQSSLKMIVNGKLGGKFGEAHDIPRKPFYSPGMSCFKEIQNSHHFLITTTHQSIRWGGHFPSSFAIYLNREMCSPWNCCFQLKNVNIKYHTWFWSCDTSLTSKIEKHEPASPVIFERSCLFSGLPTQHEAGVNLHDDKDWISGTDTH